MYLILSIPRRTSSEMRDNKHTLRKYHSPPSYGGFTRNPKKKLDKNSRPLKFGLLSVYKVYSVYTNNMMFSCIDDVAGMMFKIDIGHKGLTHVTKVDANYDFTL
uniref:Uncharacterized protein n=1 Tax=Cacopsylla melanoneura TaxID=428564 RepID=A0A8D9BDL8_9HEMI